MCNVPRHPLECMLVSSSESSKKKERKKKKESSLNVYRGLETFSPLPMYVQRRPSQKFWYSFTIQIWTLLWHFMLSGYEFHFLALPHYFLCKALALNDVTSTKWWRFYPEYFDFSLAQWEEVGKALSCQWLDPNRQIVGICDPVVILSEWHCTCNIVFGLQL